MSFMLIKEPKAHVIKALGKQCFFHTCKISSLGIVSWMTVQRISFKKYSSKLSQAQWIALKITAILLMTLQHWPFLSYASTIRKSNSMIFVGTEPGTICNFSFIVQQNRKKKSQKQLPTFWEAFLDFTQCFVQALVQSVFGWTLFGESKRLQRWF